MLYRATHVTRYRYEAPVSQCFTETRLRPRDLRNQRLLDWKLAVDPEAAVMERRRDYFGNEVASFSVFSRHEVFTTTASSIVEVLPPEKPPEDGMAWEVAREALAAHADDACLGAYEFVFDSPFVPVLPEFHEFGVSTFRPGRPLAEAACELSTRIYTEFQYRPKSTTIEMPLLDVFRLRRGVCQDFAHILIGIFRSHGLAARYVSGYLRSGANFQGAEASHAWVAVFIPSYGWLDLDPTNNLIPSDGHVTLAWGRDYGDVTPVKGISLGGGGQTVEVAVRVDPAPAEALEAKAQL